MHQFYLIVCLLFLILPSLASAIGPVEADIYLNDDRKLSNNQIQFITEGGTLRAKAKDQYTPDFITREIPMSDVAQIVFKGGQRSQQGVILSTGQFSGKIIDYKNGQWRFSLLEGAGEVAVTDETQLRSINLKNPIVPVQENRSLSVYVLDWIYTHDPFPFGTETNWRFDIKKITGAEKQILVNADVWSADSKVLNSAGCRVGCMITDDLGRTSKWVGSPWFKVPPERIKNSLSIKCPVPAPDAKSVSIALKTLWHGEPNIKVPNFDSGHARDHCKGGEDGAITLPSISMKVLRYNQ